MLQKQSQYHAANSDKVYTISELFGVHLHADQQHIFLTPDQTAPALLALLECIDLTELGTLKTAIENAISARQGATNG